MPNTPWGKYITLTPWGIIYKRSYIIQNDIKFLNENIGEDIYFNIQAINISKKVSIIDYIGYNWFYNRKSVSNTLQKNFYDVNINKLIYSCYEVMQEKGILQNDDEKDYIELFWILFVFWIFIFTGKSLTYKQLKIEYNNLFSLIEELFPNYKRNKLIGFNKLKGESLFNRIKLTIFMILHRLHLGVIALFIYVRLGEKING